MQLRKLVPSRARRSNCGACTSQYGSPGNEHARCSSLKTKSRFGRREQAACGTGSAGILAGAHEVGELSVFHELATLYEAGQPGRRDHVLFAIVVAQRRFASGLVDAPPRLLEVADLGRISGLRVPKQRMSPFQPRYFLHEAILAVDPVVVHQHALEPPERVQDVPRPMRADDAVLARPRAAVKGLPLAIAGVQRALRAGGSERAPAINGTGWRVELGVEEEFLVGVDGDE